MEVLNWKFIDYFYNAAGAKYSLWSTKYEGVWSYIVSEDDTIPIAPNGGHWKASEALKRHHL